MENVIPLRGHPARSRQIDAALDNLETLMKRRDEKWSRALGAIDALIMSAQSEVDALKARRARMVREGRE